jgi:hypothetical protein
MKYNLKDIVDSGSFPSYAREVLKIITMQGKLSNLDLNMPQLKVHSVLGRQKDAGLPMRVIILKARREGVSTYIEGRYFCEINKRPMRYACVCSADTDATNKVFAMTSLFQAEIPAELKRPTDYSNRKEIIYSPPHRSQFLCQTAGKEVLGRGGLTHYLHATEFAFWAKAKEQLGGAAQEIPDDPETIIAIESTANGTGGAFYDMYVDAVERWKHNKSLDGYIPIFLPWFIFDYYRRTPPDYWKPTHEELEIQKKFKLDIDQLYWRNWAIENKCQGDIRLFKREYPATWLEAFQATGHPVFTPGMIEYQEKYIRDDYKVGLFDPRSGTFQERPGLPYGWKYVDEPGSEDHAIGCDTAEYKLSDKSDEKSERDYDGAVVINRRLSGRKVKAKWFGRASQHELGLQLIGAGKHFNMAYIGVEIPKGVVALKLLVDSGYPNLYRQKKHEMQDSPEETDELGFRTTEITRHYLINDLISHFRAGGIIVQFQNILDQMKTFIWDKDGKPRHMPGKFDDDIFSLAIALEVDLSCPKNVPVSAIPERTGDYEPSEKNRQKTIHDLAKVGAIDDIEYDDEFSDDYYHTA